MQPHPWPAVPASTARVAKRAFRKGSLAMRARDELGAWCQDEAFSATYGTRGAPGISPAQLAMVTVLQFTEDLTDRQAADAVRGRLDWKYCLGLELDDEGFDFSVLSEFRSRLVAGAMETALLDALLTRLGALGLVGAGMPQRTDSTHVLGRIRDLNRLELAGESVRAALEALAAAAPGWLAGVIDASWQRVYGQRIDDFRLPRSTAKRADLAVRYGRDGYLLLRQVHGPAAPGWLRELPAVQALRRIWVQQFYLQAGEGGEKVIWRGDEQGLPPARSRLVSPYDTDARYAEKRGKGWTGYKVHLSETCHIPDADGHRPAPDLTASAETTLAPVTDVEMTEPVHDTLARRGLRPGEHAADSGYASAELLLAARARGITLLAPLLPDPSPQARSGGYTADMFTIDWEAKQVTCPEGQVSSSWTPARSKGTNIILARFAKATCAALPGPGPVHHRGPLRPPARLPAPPDPRGPHRRPRRAGRRRLAAEIPDPRRGGGHHRPGHPRHRHPPRPLPRPAENPPGTQHRSRRHQPDPARRLVDRQAAGPNPDHPPAAARPRSIKPKT